MAAFTAGEAPASTFYLLGVSFPLFLAHKADAYAALCGLENANLFCRSSARRGLICMFQFPE